MTNWTETAIRFMGDGQSPVFKNVEEASGGAWGRMGSMRQKLRASAGNPLVKAFIGVSSKLDRLGTDFCRPFGQLRYVTGCIPDMDISEFREVLEKLGELFDQMTEYLEQWSLQAGKTSSLSPALIRNWEEKVGALEEMLKKSRIQLKEGFQIQNRVQKSYGVWDEQLALFLDCAEPNWLSLRLLSVTMKRDHYADLDQWTGEIRKLQKDLRKPGSEALQRDIHRASQILEKYLKLKHLQKVLSLW